MLEIFGATALGFVLGTMFTAIGFLADKKKAPARSGTSDKRNPEG